jgi:hypothetical protein
MSVKASGVKVSHTGLANDASFLGCETVNLAR